MYCHKCGDEFISGEKMWEMEKSGKVKKFDKERRGCTWMQDERLMAKFKGKAFVICTEIPFSYSDTKYCVLENYKSRKFMTKDELNKSNREAIKINLLTLILIVIFLLWIFYFVMD